MSPASSTRPVRMQYFGLNSRIRQTIRYISTTVRSVRSMYMRIITKVDMPITLSP